jgi:hypothetical protein
MNTDSMPFLVVNLSLDKNHLFFDQWDCLLTKSSFCLWHSPEIMLLSHFSKK